ncbi:MAG: Short C-terminal domain [Clostridiaceae bacterium]|nr:Short C-terminal domain [Clostridiaceae bacterium]
MMIIFIILIAFAIYALSGNLQNGDFKGLGSKNNALKILEERFAKGEIDDEEYMRKRDLILKNK